MLGTKQCILNGVKSVYIYGHENYKEFIIDLDGNKIFENPESPYFRYINEGIDKGSYIDCCEPVDKYKRVIEVGSELYCCVKGEVEQVVVLKIADKPYHVGYGCHRRKLHVQSMVDPTKKWTLPDPTRTILADKT